MNEGRTGPMDRRIRVSAALVILGLVIEGVTLFWGSPASFLTFAFLGVGCVVLGAAVFLISLVTARVAGDPR
jgi:hypothetical protein